LITGSDSKSGKLGSCEERYDIRQERRGKAEAEEYHEEILQMVPLIANSSENDDCKNAGPEDNNEVKRDISSP